MRATAFQTSGLPPERPPDPLRKPAYLEFFRDLGLPRSRIGRQLALIAMIDSLGTGLFLASGSVYLSRIVGLSAFQVGLGLSVGGLVGFLGLTPIGILADRLRPGRVFIAIQILRGFGFVGYALVSSFPPFVILAAIIGIADSSVAPVYQALIGAAFPPEERVDTLARIRSLRNAGMMGGALLAMVALSSGSRIAFVSLVLGDSLSFFVAAILLILAGVGSFKTEPVKGTFRLVPDARYMLTALLNGILSIHMPLLAVGLPLWIAGHTRVPVATLGGLLAINTLMAVALQARFARPASTLSGAVQCMRWAGLSLAGFGAMAFFLSLIADTWVAIGAAVVGMILLSFGELWQSAGGWAISFALAPPDRQGQYLAAFELGTSLFAIVGPVLLTGVVFQLQYGWFAFAVVTTWAGLVIRTVVRRS